MTDYPVNQKWIIVVKMNFNLSSGIMRRQMKNRRTRWALSGPLLSKRINFILTMDIFVCDVNIWNVRCQRANENIFRVTCPLQGEFTGDRWNPLTKASGTELWRFFDLRLNERLSKQSRRRGFEMPSHPLWRHCNTTTFIFDLRTDDLEKMSQTLRQKMFRLLHPL